MFGITIERGPLSHYFQRVWQIWGPDAYGDESLKREYFGDAPITIRMNLSHFRSDVLITESERDLWLDCL